MRAFTQLWDELTQERYGVEDAKHRRFRYGVQVNSLGLTEAQPENNVQRIVLEMLAVTLSKDARARAVQLPAWNEALGLPRPWDQQWSLRLQQVLAFETDLLEYEDLFAGSVVVEQKVAEIVEGARAEIARVQEMGGAVAAVESGYMKSALVGSLAERRRRIESGEDVVVGVNRFETTEPNPLLADLDTAIMTVDPAVENAAQEAVRKWRAERDQAAADKALDALREAAGTDTNLMAATLDCARAGVTTGEWAGVLREVFGEYRAPTGVAAASGGGEADETLTDVRERVRATGEELGGRLRFLVGKPGLDGHSNGAEQIAVRARDAGFEVDLPGHPADPGADRRRRGRGGRARRRAVGAVGLAPAGRARRCSTGLKEAGLDDVPVVVGGIIPDSDAAAAARAGRGPGLHAQGLRAHRDHGLRRRRDPRGERPRREGARAGMSGDGAPRVERDGDVVRITMTRPAKRERAVPRAPDPAAGRRHRGRRRATPPGSCSPARGRCSAPGTTSPTSSGQPLPEVRSLLELCTELMQTVQDVPQVVIARVHALATAAGCQLVASCDLAVAAESAGFAAPGRQGRLVLPHADGRDRPQRRPQARHGAGAHRRRHRRRDRAGLGAGQPGRARRRARRGGRRPDGAGHPRLAGQQGLGQADDVRPARPPGARRLRHRDRGHGRGQPDPRRPRGHGRRSSRSATRSGTD